MASGAELQSKIKATLITLQATSRVVSFSRTVRTGGNSTLGIGGTETVTITSIETQPAVELITSEMIAGGSGLLQPGDYMFTFAGDVDEALFREQQILYGTEVLNIVQAQPYAFKGVVAAWGVVGRTITTRTG